MKKLFLALLPLAGCATPAEQVRVAPALAVIEPAAPATPVGNPLVGGATMPVDRTIGAALAAAPPLGTLLRAVGAAGQAAALEATEPVTLFAPSDEAFGRLAPGTLDALFKPENHDTLVKLLRLHLVAGRLSSAELVRRIAAGGGRATLTTLAGEVLTLGLTGSVITLTDGGGNRSYIETADVRQRNGVIHLVNGVLVPRLDPARP